MKCKYWTYLFLAIGLNLSSLIASAQNLGNYIAPFENQSVKLSDYNLGEKDQLAFLAKHFPSQDYPFISFSLLAMKESLGARHYTYQVSHDEVILEQVIVKIHVNKEKGHLILMQSNIPLPDQWKQLASSELNAANHVWLYFNNVFVKGIKELLIDEAEDFYAERFNLGSNGYLENILKYHSDTSAYGKVFNPDPLTSANQVYGGFYQDAFTLDTSALLIQNINNQGGTTVTANGTTFSYDGQSFSVPTESYVNTFTAPILKQVFENIYLDGQGGVIGFNTAITEDLSTYTTQIIREDYNYPSLQNELVWKSFPVDFSGGTFNLTNDYFIISEFSSPFTNPAFSVSDSFDFNRSDIEFEDVNAFYHLNNYRDYWINLGFTGLDTEVLLVDAHGNNGADNSFFSPTSPPRLVFGQGGVDDAEDADVIIHEYGHAISNFASPGSNVGDERRALDEGFGDYLATSYSRMFSPFNSELVFSWDGHNEFWAGRISNSNKTKSDIDINESIYYNGEIWSASLMDLYDVIGGVNADKLAIEVMYYNMPNGSITDAALNLFIADTTIFNGVHTCAIFDVLFARKFLVGTCTDFSTGIRPNYQNDGQVQLLNSDGFTFRQENLILKLNNSIPENAHVNIIALDGNLIKSIALYANYQELVLKDLAPGIYFIELRTNDKPYRFKVMKN